MRFLRRLYKRIMELNPYTRFSFKLGLFLMTVCYIVAIAARLFAPYASDWFYVLSLYRGCAEAAPAFLAVGVCAGLLGDLMLRQEGSDSDSNHRQ